MRLCASNYTERSVFSTASITAANQSDLLYEPGIYGNTNAIEATSLKGSDKY